MAISPVAVVAIICIRLTLVVQVSLVGVALTNMVHRSKVAPKRNYESFFIGDAGWLNAHRVPVHACFESECYSRALFV